MVVWKQGVTGCDPAGSGRAQNRKAALLNRRAAARYRALASIIPGRERFSYY